MNIVHIAPNAPYNEGWGYQENLLPKYQAKFGHKVTLIITNRQHSEEEIISVDPVAYKSNDGFKVIRLPQVHFFSNKITLVLGKLNVYDILLEMKPDFIFFHGLESITIFQVTKYKRHINPNLIIVQDNHVDYNLGYTWYNGIKPFLLCLKNKIIHKLSKRYISRVYGVTPWRKEYAEKIVGVSNELTDVLIMGADDEKIDLAHKQQIRTAIRSEYEIRDKDFLIVTGGKIDQKKKIDILMEACIRDGNVKLLIFGNVMDDVKEKFDKLVQDNPNLIYIGWVRADEVYKYYFAADLVFFPGQHSVLWEQACASKVPCVFERWDGMNHVNNGGNSDFVSPVTVETILDKIRELKFTEKYYRMKDVAESVATDIYLYSKIAEKSLECVKNAKKIF